MNKIFILHYKRRKIIKNIIKFRLLKTLVSGESDLAWRL